VLTDTTSQPIFSGRPVCPPGLQVLSADKGKISRIKEENGHFPAFMAAERLNLPNLPVAGSKVSISKSGTVLPTPKQRSIHLP